VADVSDEVERLAQRIRQAERTGPARYVYGTTTGAPSGGWVQVDRGGGDYVQAQVPGTFRSTVTAGQEVRLSVQGRIHTLDAVLTALAAPTVAAPPAASGIDPGANTTSTSGCYDYTIGDNDWNAVRAYTRDIAESTRGIAGDVNECRDDIDWNADDLASLKTTVNNLRTTVAAMRTALAAQGHIT
jgi:hypothetical protein